MRVACLDLEGVLIPEIWLGLAEKTGLQELQITTRDIPDFDKLMRRRLAILEEKRITMRDLREVVRRMDPLPGAVEFITTLRAKMPVIILSDTFEQFVPPLMEKLGYPTLFCNTLVLDPEERIVDYTLRQGDGKRHAVLALRSMNLEVFASGDSYNDLSMIKEADRGAFFRAPATILEEEREYPGLESYEELLDFLLQR
ncbi:MAG: bifunctional phosphoserine phosphatase/homoserine phosphotransferase ThrH [Alkalispirochaetaceae bacterium]